MGNDVITITDHTTQQVESYMSKNRRIRQNKKQHIQGILPTDDQLTGRAGLSLFAMYLRKIQLFPLTGLPVPEVVAGSVHLATETG